MAYCNGRSTVNICPFFSAYIFQKKKFGLLFFFAGKLRLGPGLLGMLTPGALGPAKTGAHGASFWRRALAQRHGACDRVFVFRQKHGARSGGFTTHSMRPCLAARR